MNKETDIQVESFLMGEESVLDLNETTRLVRTRYNRQRLVVKARGNWGFVWVAEGEPVVRIDNPQLDPNWCSPDVGFWIVNGYSKHLLAVLNRRLG